MTTRVVDGVHVEVTTTGEGEPLVVIPDGPARHPAYLEELGGLTDDGYGLITLYPHGVGPSPRPRTPPTTPRPASSTTSGCARRRRSPRANWRG